MQCLSKTQHQAPSSTATSGPSRSYNITYQLGVQVDHATQRRVGIVPLMQVRCY